jgi:hypothetical protein
MLDTIIPVCIFLIASVLNYRMITLCVSKSTRWSRFSLYNILLWVIEIIVCLWLAWAGIDIDGFIYGGLLVMFYFFPVTIFMAILFYLLIGCLRYYTYDRKVLAGEKDNN